MTRTSSKPDAVPARGRRKQGRTPGAGLGDAEEAGEVEEEDRGALGPFLLLDLLEVEEDDEEASQTTAERARWVSAPLFPYEEGETEGRKRVATARGKP